MQLNAENQFFVAWISKQLLPTCRKYFSSFSWKGSFIKLNVPNFELLSSIISLFFSNLILVCNLDTDISFNLISHSFPLPYFPNI